MVLRNSYQYTFDGVRAALTCPGLKAGLFLRLFLGLRQGTARRSRFAPATWRGHAQENRAQQHVPNTLKR